MPVPPFGHYGHQYISTAAAVADPGGRARARARQGLGVDQPQPRAVGGLVGAEQAARQRLDGELAQPEGADRQRPAAVGGDREVVAEQGVGARGILPRQALEARGEHPAGEGAHAPEVDDHAAIGEARELGADIGEVAREEAALGEGGHQDRRIDAEAAALHGGRLRLRAGAGRAAAARRTPPGRAR